jgi:DNA-binding transcriptional regulator YbjK
MNKNNESREFVNYQGRKISRQGGLERRQLILRATWQIIIKDGMRGVRHRAVAKEADVPLAATTYYFKDMEELITSAFVYWAEQSSVHSIRFREECFDVVRDITQSEMSDVTVRLRLAEQISALTINHIIDQIVNQYQDRILELAFHHEAFRNEKLKSVVLNQQHAFVADLQSFHEKVGSRDPKADAQISMSLIMRLEQEAIMQGLESYDQSHIKRVVRRHIFSVFEVTDSHLADLETGF